MSPITRRRFLQSLTAAGAATAGGGLLLARSEPGVGPIDPMAGSDRTRPDIAATETALDGPGRMVPGAADDRILVVIDLQGGNDGLSTLVPAGDARYHDLRPNLAVPEDEVLALDDEVGLHPAMGRLHRRGITTVEGVGPVDGDLSHFAMMERWQRGDVGGDNRLRTGFLGRLADSLDDGSPLVGMSMSGPTAHLITSGAATMAINGPDDLWFLEPDDWDQTLAYQRGLVAFGPDRGTGEGVDGGVHGGAEGTLRDGPVDERLSGLASSSYHRLLSLAAELSSADDAEADWEDPMMSEGGWLGQNLYFAADLIAAEVGIRVVYLGHGDFDTHQGHQWRQADNLAQLDAAVDGFLNRVEAQGMADRVLVATISEFGRRVPESDDGLDHGSASTMLLAGPVEDRRLGQRPDLGDLDEDDNLRVAIGFDRYLAGLAEDWLGVEAASVLPGAPEPLRLV